MENINPELVKFIVARLGVEPDKIRRDVGIETQFGLASPETDWFYEAFLDAFGIKIPDQYRGNHISPEGCHGCSPIHIFERCFSKRYREEQKYVDITVRNLERMICTKTWEVDKGR